MFGGNWNKNEHIWMPLMKIRRFRKIILNDEEQLEQI